MTPTPEALAQATKIATRWRHDLVDDRLIDAIAQALTEQAREIERLKNHDSHHACVEENVRAVEDAHEDWSTPKEVEAKIRATWEAAMDAVERFRLVTGGSAMSRPIVNTTIDNILFDLHARAAQGTTP